jgi:histone acetyltransferase (RNA polymerase elongator complex component)
MTSPSSSSATATERNAGMRPWIAPIFLAHLGCIHRCVFCNQYEITGSPCAPTPQGVRERLESFFRARKDRRPASVRQIAFYGGSFSRLNVALQEDYLGIAREYVQRGWVDSIRISTRPDALSEGQITLLRRGCVRTVELGIQSLSDRVLAASRRGHSRRDSLEAIGRLREAGFEVGAQMMLGLPGDRGAESLETAEVLCAVKPDFVRIYPVLVLRGTELAARMQEGLYRPLDLEEAVSLGARLLERFDSASIPVIRIGLQETDGLGPQGGSVLAGPHHPAFGHLVRSSSYYRKMLSALAQRPSSSASIRFRIHPRDRSLLCGHQGIHAPLLRRESGVSTIEIEEDESVPRGHVECADPSGRMGGRKRTGAWRIS